MTDLRLIQPSEFWSLTTGEASLFLDSFYEQRQLEKQVSGKITDRQIERLEQKRKQLEQKGVNVL